MDQSNNGKIHPQVNHVPPQQQQPMGYAYQGAQQHSSPATVIIQQPVQQRSLWVANVRGHRDWTSGVCDCFSDISGCCFVCCCYPCAICQLASRTGECLCTPCCVPSIEINLRTRIRTLGGIQGSMCDDCLIVSCCPMCAACQESRELTAMGVP